MVLDYLILPIRYSSFTNVTPICIFDIIDVHTSIIIKVTNGKLVELLGEGLVRFVINAVLVAVSCLF